VPFFTAPFSEAAYWTGGVPRDSWKAVLRALKDTVGRYGVNGDEVTEMKDPYS